uniref:Desmoplakin-like n=1 Tax=Oncorhynchus tshawytscha TaxID=74940 RepID=A0A8C8F6H0_ONCTS
MSLHTSQRNRKSGSRPDLSGGTQHYDRSEVHGGNVYGQEYMDGAGYNTYSYSKTSMGGGGGVQGQSTASALQQKAYILQGQCQEYLRKAEHCLQAGGDSGRATAEAERFMAMAKETIEQLNACARDLSHMGQSNDNVFRSIDLFRDQLKGVHMAVYGTMQRRSRGSRGSGAWEEAGRSFNEAIAWIGQQKRLIETSPWGDDSAAIEQQLISHNKFHSSIQRSAEVDRAKDELFKKGDKANQHALDQDWDTLQKMSHGRSNQLRELQQIIEEISREIMWVNEREEEELVFDWGEKNIDLYIPKKQESYSKLMSTLEEKEKDLNKLKLKVDSLLKNHHPASDKIEAYMDTLQTQWSWLLQITKCIHVHLKENAAYSQFFKEANETYSKLQKEHENIRRKFTSDRNTPLENLLELLNGLEKEKEWILENKRQVQHLVNMSKSIVRLRPRNPEEEKSSSPVMVQALCDFKQDQKVILKGNEGILKDNSQRSKWQVTGPGGLDMLVPSVCLLVPPPNSLGINLANKNEQYYEAILSVWNQLYINIKSLISWQYCVQDITRINSLTITMLSRMRPEEYRSILKGLETHYSDFIHCCHGSEMFKDDDKRNIESQYTGAQAHYDQLVVQLPAYNGIMRVVNYVDRLKQHLKTSVRKLKLGHNVSSKWTLTPSTLPKLWHNVVVTSHSLTELHTLRQRLEEAEAGLTQHIHICLGEDGAHDCGLRISQLESVQRDVNSIREEYQRLNEHVLQELEGMTDSDKATFLRSQLSLINERLGSLDGCSTAYLQRLRALRALLESESRAEDIIKVHEARLTEKETTSLDPAEVEDYRSTLKSMRAELEGKRDVLVSMETELGKAVHWNGQVGGAFHRCDVDLSRYSEQVTQLSDRWRRLQSQIDFRLRDLEGYQGQLQQYTTTSSVLSEWIGTTRQKQDALQATKIDSITALDEHLNQQKALNSEIKVKRESVESVLRDTDACVNSIKDYELELASYSAGLETLLNIPMKRTMTQSPSTQLTEEATLLQTRYIELLTLSGDYYKYLGELHKNMEELKMRNTRIDLLEEELRLLKEDIGYRNTKNSSLEEALARYRLELSQSQEQLHSVEEVKRSKALQCSVTQDSLASTHSQLKDLQEQVARLTSLIEEEKRKRMRAEEHYREQQEEHEQVLRRRQKELEEANWAKLEVEKSVGDRDREAERLRRQLEEEVRRCKDLEQELSKVRSQYSVEISNLKLSYESQITFCRTDIQHLSAQREEVDQGIRLQCDKLEAERRDQEDQLRRLKVCLNQAEEQRRRAEEEALAQRSVVTEEVQRRRELEAQVEMLVRERGEDSNQYREEVSELTKALQEMSGQQVHLTHSLEEEQRRRRALEEEKIRLELLLGEIQAKQASYSQAVTRLREVEEELVSIRTEFKKENGEKNKAEQSVTRLQGHVRELQATADRLEGEAEALRRTNQEEVTKRRHVETELQKTTHTMREYTSTIATLRRSQEEALTTVRRGEEEHRKLQVELESRLKEFKASTERLTSLSSELKSLQQQLLQEQAKVREANMRNETLYKTIEEKSLALNESSVELERLQTLTQTLTKERLRLEEELRGLKHEREELLITRQGADDELVSQNTALELQLKSSLRSSVETQILVAELSSEREKLRMEIDQVQRQAMETSSLIQSTKTQYSEMVVERDALLLKLKQTDQDRAMSQKLEEELNRIKLSLESELRLKLRLQEENEKVKNDFLYWKGQYESKEGAVRQFDSVKEKLERERSSLETEIERLMRELREGEDRYKSRLLITQTQLSELTSVRDTLEADLRKLREQHNACAKHTQTDKNGKKDLDPGLRGEVSIKDLMDANLLEKSDMDQLKDGKLTSQDIEDRLRSYLRGSTCIAGVYDEANHKTLSIYQAMKEGLLRPGTTLELLEAQAASGFMIDPINNLCLTVADAYKSGLAGPEFKDKLLSAERAVTGYKDPGTDKIISLFQAIEKGLMEKGHGIRLLEAQIASGGIIDPRHSHRIEVETAYKKGYFGKEMNQILTDEADVSKGFFDPNNQDNLTYLQLKKRCIIDQKTGLVLLPIKDKKEPPQTTTQKNTLRKRRVVIVDPDTNKEMSVKEAYDKGLIDYETFLELSQQECEWEEITITAQDGSSRLVIIDRKTEIQYDIRELLEKKVIDQSVYDQYQSQKITLAQFAKIITSKTNSTRSSSSTSSSKARASATSASSLSSSTTTSQSPVGAIFDMEALEKISISEAHKRGLVDSISAQRLLEAQACTGGIVNPSDGRRLSIQEASRQGIIENDMATRLKPAQKAYIGFEDVKCKRKMSAAEAMREKWLPYEAGHRFLEFQFVTGGLYDPELGCRRTIEEALKVGWLDGRAAQKLQDMRHHAKNLTCPKTKLKISYKEALDNCLLEENTGVKMLQAASTSSRGISSPYNFSSAPGSTSGSRTGSRTGSRRGSVDLGSPSSSSRYNVISSSTYSRTSFSSSSIS